MQSRWKTLFVTGIMAGGALGMESRSARAQAVGGPQVPAIVDVPAPASGPAMPRAVAPAGERPRPVATSARPPRAVAPAVPASDGSIVPAAGASAPPVPPAPAPPIAPASAIPPIPSPSTPRYFTAPPEPKKTTFLGRIRDRLIGDRDAIGGEYNNAGYDPSTGRSNYPLARPWQKSGQ